MQSKTSSGRAEDRHMLACRFWFPKQKYTGRKELRACAVLNLETLHNLKGNAIINECLLWINFVAE